MIKTLDVIITSTGRRTIIPTLKSFREKIVFSGKYNFIVNIDALHKKDLHKVIKFLSKEGFNNININIEGSSIGHAKAINYLFNKIKTPFFFHLEDDWLFFKEVNLDQLIQIMVKHSEIDHIRLSKRTIRSEAWLYYKSNRIKGEEFVPKENVLIEELSLVKTSIWSFNPSLNRTNIAKQLLEIPLGINPEIYLCKKYYEEVGRDGCYIYGKIGDKAIIKDIGRNNSNNFLRRLKSLLPLNNFLGK